MKTIKPSKKDIIYLVIILILSCVVVKEYTVIKENKVIENRLLDTINEYNSMFVNKN